MVHPGAELSDKNPDISDEVKIQLDLLCTPYLFDLTYFVLKE